MKALKLLGVIALPLLLWGCSEVTSSAPIGEKPLVLDAEEWNGTWIIDEYAITFLVEDAEQGRLQIAWVEASESNLKMSTELVHFRTSGKWVFANTLDGDASGGEERYVFLRVEKDEDQIFLWGPDAIQFTEAVEAGRLPGEIDGKDVHLSALSASHVEVIKSDSDQVMFIWGGPVVLQRIGK